MTKENKKPESGPVMPKEPMELCLDWRNHISPDKQKMIDYVRSEMERVMSEGGPVILSVLRMEEIPRAYALKEVLGNPEDDVFGGRRWKVALIPGVVPPEKDPHGALLPEGKRGKVLAAKVGLRSREERQDPGQTTVNANPKFSAPNTQAAFSNARMKYGYPQSPYIIKEIGSEPVELKTEDAITVIKRYGWGSLKQDNTLNEDSWFVTEV